MVGTENGVPQIERKQRNLARRCYFGARHWLSKCSFELSTPSIASTNCVKVCNCLVRMKRFCIPAKKLRHCSLNRGGFNVNIRLNLDRARHGISPHAILPRGK